MSGVKKAAPRETWGVCEPKSLELREGKPRQPSRAYEGPLGAVGASKASLGRLGSSCLGSDGLYDKGGAW